SLGVVACGGGRDHEHAGILLLVQSLQRPGEADSFVPPDRHRTIMSQPVTSPVPLPHITGTCPVEGGGGGGDLVSSERLRPSRVHLDLVGAGLGAGGHGAYVRYVREVFTSVIAVVGGDVGADAFTDAVVVVGVHGYLLGSVLVWSAPDIRRGGPSRCVCVQLQVTPLSRCLTVSSDTTCSPQLHRVPSSAARSSTTSHCAVRISSARSHNHAQSDCSVGSPNVSETLSPWRTTTSANLRSLSECRSATHSRGGVSSPAPRIHSISARWPSAAPTAC